VFIIIDDVVSSLAGKKKKEKKWTDAQTDRKQSRNPTTTTKENATGKPEWPC